MDHSHIPAPYDVRAVLLTCSYPTLNGEGIIPSERLEEAAMAISPEQFRALSLPNQRRIFRALDDLLLRRTLECEGDSIPEIEAAQGPCLRRRRLLVDACGKPHLAHAAVDA
jgi:hypothetical protein